MERVMRPGLVSVTFRKLGVLEVARRAAQAGLGCIEWGGDIHVPHGDLVAAREAARITATHGLAVSAYGSYLRLGARGGPSAEVVVETAAALGAPLIRVWAGDKGSKESTPAERARVVESALEIAGLAQSAGMTIAYEYHRNTLTDGTASTLRLLEETTHPAIRAYWQPPVGRSKKECLGTLEAILPWLANVHAFHWWPTASQRLPLEKGANRWRDYLGIIQAHGLKPDVLLEFVPHDDPALLDREAGTLRRWLEAQMDGPLPLD